MLLTGFLLPGLLDLLSYTAQDHQPRDGTVQDELGPPTSIFNYQSRKHTTGSFPQTNLVRHFHEAISSPITPTFVK